MKPLRVTSLLLAIAIVGANSNAHGDDDPMIPVDLTCPANASNGTLEMIDQSAYGSRRVRVLYSDGSPVSITMEAAPSGGTFFGLESFKIGAEKNETERDLAQSISIKANALKTGICEGSAQDRAKYDATLRANAASVSVRRRQTH